MSEVGKVTQLRIRRRCREGRRKMDECRLKEVIACLKSKGGILSCSGEYPNYAPEVYALLGSLGSDRKYMENYEKLKDMDTDKLRLCDLRTMYTYISRGERFCAGFIAGSISEGMLLKLAERHLELIKEQG